MYDTGATATEDEASVATGERVGPGFLDAAGALTNGAIPTDGAGVAGGTSVVGDGRREDADAGGVPVAAAEPVARELVDVCGLVGGDVVTDVTAKPDPFTSTSVPGRPCVGSSVMTGPAVRIGDDTGGGVGPTGTVNRSNVASAQTVGAAIKQASTGIGTMHRSASHVTGVQGLPAEHVSCVAGVTA